MNELTSDNVPIINVEYIDPVIDSKINADKFFDMNVIDVEDLKRRVKDRVTGFPKVSFLVYSILALANVILIGYLLFSNTTDNTMIALIKWALYLISIALFFINVVLFTQSFENKKLILMVVSLMQLGFLSLTLVLSYMYGNDSDNYFLVYISAGTLNIFTFLFSMIPVYYTDY